MCRVKNSRQLLASCEKMHLLEEDVVGTMSLISGRGAHGPRTDGQTDDL